MKNGFITACIFLLASCSQPKEPEKREKIASDTIVTSEIAAADTASRLDAVSSATSKANQVSFNGILITPPNQHATISLTMSGTIKSMSILPGAYIKKGSTLATIENPDFITLQQEYLDSHAQLEYLETEYLRQKTLATAEAASQKKLQESKANYLSMESRMKSAETKLSLLGVTPAVLKDKGIQSYLKVTAPISGYIMGVTANLGKYIPAGEALCEIIDKSRTLLKLTAYEKDIKNIKVGDKVQFKVNGMGKDIFSARLISVGQSVDDINRSLEVYAETDRPNSDFRPGMYVTARIYRD